MQNDAIAVIESDEPSIIIDVKQIGDKGLDEGISILLVESKGSADRDLLANLLVERHRRARADESAAWLRDCETIWLLSSQTFENEMGQTEPLWRKYAADPDWSWGSFAQDILNISPSVATSRKRIWQIFRKRLRWTPDVIARIGPSRLGVAVAQMEHALDSGGDDELEGMLLGDGSGQDGANWRDVWLYVQSKSDERRRLEGKPARVKFKERFVLDESTGEIVGFSLTTWLDDLIYDLGEFRWNPELPGDIKSVIEGALLDALRRGPRRL